MRPAAGTSQESVSLHIILAALPAVASTLFAAPGALVLWFDGGEVTDRRCVRSEGHALQERTRMLCCGVEAGSEEGAGYIARRGSGGGDAPPPPPDARHATTHRCMRRWAPWRGARLTSRRGGACCRLYVWRDSPPVQSALRRQAADVAAWRTFQGLGPAPMGRRRSTTMRKLVRMYGSEALRCAPGARQGGPSCSSPSIIIHSMRSLSGIADARRGLAACAARPQGLGCGPAARRRSDRKCEPDPIRWQSSGAVARACGGRRRPRRAAWVTRWVRVESLAFELLKSEPTREPRNPKVGPRRPPSPGREGGTAVGHPG